jgi:hypothetical protein
MPANSYTGQRSVTATVRAEASYTFDRAVAYADVLAVPGGGTSLVLPDEPSNGDSYEWANPDGSVGAGNVLTIALSAAAIAAGVTIQGASSRALTTSGASGRAVFFDEPNAWALFLSGTPAAAGTPGSEIVWRPGVAPVPGVVATWAQVMAAIAATPVPLTVYADPTHAALVVPGALGNQDGLGTTTLRPFLDAETPNTQIEVQDGTTLLNFQGIEGSLTLLCDCATTAALAFAYGATPAPRFVLREGATVKLDAAAAVAAIQIPVGDALQIFQRGGILDDSLAAGIPVVMIGNGGTLTLIATDSDGANLYNGGSVIHGFGGTTVQLLHDDTVPRPDFGAYGFFGTVTETRLSLAAWAEPYASTFATFPATPNVQTGQIAWSTDLGALFTWTGAAWVLVGPGAVVFDPNPPGSPTTNIRSNRSANQSPITGGGTVGATNLGSDTTGVTTGVSATYATIGGGDQNVTSSSYATVPGGIGNQATGRASLAEGNASTASGAASHAEGAGTTASGAFSHAEGDVTAASGSGAHSEGANTTASGDQSHAEGSNTVASGVVSHAAGYQSIAHRLGQQAVAAGHLNVDGDSQQSLCILNGRGGQFVLSGGSFLLDSGQAYLVHAEGIVQSATDFAAYSFDVPCSFAGGAIVFPAAGVPGPFVAAAATATAAAVAGNWTITITDGGGGDLVFTFSQTSVQGVQGTLAVRFTEVGHP